MPNFKWLPARKWTDSSDFRQIDTLRWTMIREVDKCKLYQQVKMFLN